ncbi:unnamed protein product, partial [Ectocarpus sp. 6 AP-2014]
RERNRVLARQTRLRKKFFYESLLKHMAALRKDNRKFKTILRDRLGERAQQVVFDCTSELSRQVTAGSMEDAEGTDGAVTMTMVVTDVQADAEVAAAAKGGEDKDTGGASKRGGGGGGDGGGAGASTRGLSRPDYRLMKSIEMAQQNFVVTEPSLSDNPIVFASDGFFKLTGYTSKEVIGRNCRFLQGPDTDRKSVATLRQAIARGEDVSVCLLNYKADGTTFWNQFFVAALRDDQHRIVNYVGAQCVVPYPPPLAPPRDSAAGAVVAV